MKDFGRLFYFESHYELKRFLEGIKERGYMIEDSPDFEVNPQTDIFDEKSVQLEGYVKPVLSLQTLTQDGGVSPRLEKVAAYFVLTGDFPSNTPDSKPEIRGPPETC